MSRIHDMLQPQGPVHGANGTGHNGNGFDSGPTADDAQPTMENNSSSMNWRDTELVGGVNAEWAPNKKTMLFFGSEQTPSACEQFRMLRSRLYHLRERMSLKTLLVTSSLPKEGRSFTAANLAQALACQQGCRVLLIDADLRSPSLHRSLGTFPTPGLADYLFSDVEEFAVLQKGQIENLCFIPSGRAISGQAEILSNGRLQQLLTRVSPFFEWIIIDSPAAIPVSDAGLISNFCDGVLLVVRSHSTPFDIVRKARERFREERLLGVVLNGTPPDSQLDNHYYPDAMDASPEAGSGTAGKGDLDRHKKTLLQLIRAAAAAFLSEAVSQSLDRRITGVR